jgi:glyoxalase family protein
MVVGEIAGTGELVRRLRLAGVPLYLLSNMPEHVFEARLATWSILQGFDGAIAHASDPEAGRPLLEEALGFQPLSGEDGQSGWECRGESRGGLWGYSEPPAERGLQGAGSVHHIAWASQIDDHEAWRERVIAAGAHPTPVIDRFYFRSIYFREPSGVLFEIATLGPGFTVDEPLESLGEKLSLPPDYEHLREQVEPVLRPINNPRVTV